MVRSRSTGRANFLALVLTVTGTLAACTTPGASQPSSAASAAPSDAMMEHSPSPSDAMIEHSAAPSDAMMEHSPSPSDAMMEHSPSSS
jgi:hypothetical protein